jgi:antibiotic biosynthesis monooxygenase (ABM) superfamily enzyme
MLYRFANEETLEAWEQSPERSSRLSKGEGFVRSERSKRRTGIEGWFDDPATGSVPVTDASAPGSGADIDLPPAPPRWKQAVTIWLGFFPVNLAFTLLVTTLVPGWDDLAVVWRVLITTLLLTPVMTFWALPFITRMLRSWLAPTG